MSHWKKSKRYQLLYALPYLLYHFVLLLVSLVTGSVLTLSIHTDVH